jgi:O-antigen/teichoic acid export membrane protein
MMTAAEPRRGSQLLTRSPVVRAGAAVGAARLASLVLAGVQLPLLTRLVPTDTYALFPLALTLATYLGLVAADPVILAFQRFPGSASERRSYIRARRGVGIGLLVAATAVLVVGLATARLDMACAVIAWGLGLAVNRFTAVAWLMWGRDWKYAVNLTASTVARTVALVVIVASGAPLLLGVTCAGLLSAVVAVALAPRGRTRTGSTELEQPQWTLPFGIRLAVAQLAVTALASSPLVILVTLQGSASAAGFATMTQVATLTGAALTLITTASYPRLRALWEAGQHPAVRNAVTTTALVFVAIGAAAAGASTAGDAGILRTIVPAEYVIPAVVAPLMASSAFASVAVSLAWLYQFELRSKTVLVRTALSSTFGIVSTVALTHSLGPQGAAAGSLLGFAATVAVLGIGTKGLRPELIACLVLLAGASTVALSSAVPVSVTSSGFIAVSALSALLARRNHHATRSA